MEPMDFSILNEFKELMGDDGEAEVRELINLYLEDSPCQLADIKTAMATGDWEVLGRAAHSFKSSCGNIGAVVLQELCLELERRAAAQNLDDGEGLVSQVDAAFVDVKEALNAYMNS